MFPVLLLSALLNPSLRKQRLTVQFLTYSEAAAKTNFLRFTFKTAQCERNACFLGWRDLKNKKTKKLLYTTPCGLIDDKLINKFERFISKVTLLLIKMERLAVARQNKISLFFKQGVQGLCPCRGSVFQKILIHHLVIRCFS